MDDNNVQNSLCITSVKQELSGPTEAHGPFIYVPPCMTGGTLCFWAVRPSVCHTLRVRIPLCVQRSEKARTFQQIIMHVWQCPHYVDVQLLYCFDFDLHLIFIRFNLFPRTFLTWIFCIDLH